MWMYQMYPQNSYYGGYAPGRMGYQPQGMSYYTAAQNNYSPTETGTAQRRLSDPDKRSTAQPSLPTRSSFFSNGSNGASRPYEPNNSFYNYGSAYDMGGGSFYGLQGFMRADSAADFYDDNTSRQSYASRRSGASAIDAGTRGGMSIDDTYSPGGNSTNNQSDHRNFSGLVRKKSTLHRNMDSDSGSSDTHRIGRSQKLRLIGEEQI